MGFTYPVSLGAIAGPGEVELWLGIPRTTDGSVKKTAITQVRKPARATVAGDEVATLAGRAVVVVLPKGAPWIHLVRARGLRCLPSDDFLHRLARSVDALPRNGGGFWSEMETKDVYKEPTRTGVGGGGRAS